MPIMLGSNAPDVLMVGSASVDALYLGSDLLWSPVPAFTFNDAEDYPTGNVHDNGYDVAGKTANGSSKFDYYNLGPDGINSVIADSSLGGSKLFEHSSNGHSVSSYNAWLDMDHDVPEYISAQFIVDEFAKTTIVMQMRNTGNGAMCAIQFDKSSGKIRLLGNGGRLLATSDYDVPIDTPFRLELGLLVASTSVGKATMRFFSNPTGTTPTETLAATGANTNTGTPGRDIFGLYNAVLGNTLRIKNHRKSNTDWPPAP